MLFLESMTATKRLRIRRIWIDCLGAELRDANEIGCGFASAAFRICLRSDRVLFRRAILHCDPRVLFDEMPSAKRWSSLETFFSDLYFQFSTWRFAYQTGHGVLLLVQQLWSSMGEHRQPLWSLLLSKSPLVQGLGIIALGLAADGTGI